MIVSGDFQSCSGKHLWGTERVGKAVVKKRCCGTPREDKPEDLISLYA